MSQQGDPRLIQPSVRLSESRLWDIQKNYFETASVEAWKQEVPCYISSNAFVGERYAECVLAYLKDRIAAEPSLQKETFYLLELGSGTGKFSFYFLKYWLSQQIDIPICYIISDVVKENVEFCQKNESLQPFIEQGLLDFAYFDVENSKDIELIRAQKSYSQLKGKTPLIIIGNYTFDCVRQDTFETDGKSLKAAHLELRSRYPDFNQQKAKHLEDLRLHFSTVETDIAQYYPNPFFNQLLQSYQQQLMDKEALVMMPLGAFSFLENIAKLTDNHYFMIAGDKGVSLSEKFEFFPVHYRVTFDGCYSFNVNFHAMGEYVKHLKGDYLPSQTGNNFKINLFSGDRSFSELPQTTQYFQTVFEIEGPDEYCSLYDEFLASGYRFDIKSLLSMLRYSRYDPYAYAAIHERLEELYPKAQPQVADDVKKALKQIEDNIYLADIDVDVFRLLGLFYHRVKDYDKALALYQASIDLHGGKAMTYHNMALIYEKLKQNKKAVEHYQLSLKKDKKNEYAKRRVYILTGRPLLALTKPVIKSVLVIGVILYISYAAFT